MRLTESIGRLQSIAEEMGVDLKAAAAFVLKYEEMQKTEHDENSTTPETRSSLKDYLNKNNGAVQNLSPKDICLNAGVPPNRGNINFARGYRKLLTHHKT